METTSLLPGTLDLLLLKALSLEPMHGYGIALRLRQISGDVFQVEEGTLYPALQRLLAKCWSPPNGSRLKTIAAHATTA